ncbi:MAG: hypothetical protein WDN06_11055 [Asticcacaulis sp.]
MRQLNETLERRIGESMASIDRSWRKSRDLQVVTGVDGVLRAVNPAWGDYSRPQGRRRRRSPFQRVRLARGPRPVTPYQRQRQDARRPARRRESFSSMPTARPRWISWRATTEGDFIYSYGPRRYRRKAAGRGAGTCRAGAAAGPEDGSRGPVDRRHRPRFQQHAGRHHGPRSTCSTGGSAMPTRAPGASSTPPPRPPGAPPA